MHEWQPIHPILKIHKIYSRKTYKQHSLLTTANHPATTYTVCQLTKREPFEKDPVNCGCLHKSRAIDLSFPVCLQTPMALQLGALFARPLRPLTTSFSGINISVPRIPCRSPIYGLRQFTRASILRATHYDTLGVPRTATKGQIKSSFYNVSLLTKTPPAYLLNRDRHAA